MAGTPNDILLWALVLVITLSSLVDLAWSSPSQGRMRFLYPVLLVAPFVVLLAVLPPADDAPRPWGLLLVAAILTPGVLARVARAHTVGAGLLADLSTPWPGALNATRARRRLDRAIRREGGLDGAPSDPVLAPADQPHVTAAGLFAVTWAAAAHVRDGDLAGATRVIDEVFQRPPPRHWPDATLGLLLHHRTVYACLGAARGVVVPDAQRCRSDTDLARTVLPDVRLGWLADAASAAGDGRWPTAAISAAAVVKHARGGWEAGLAALVGAWALPDPSARVEALATVAARHPWLAALARAAPARAREGA